MMFGMSQDAFTLLHVVISVAGIVSGSIVLGGLLRSKPLALWTALFLLTTVLTSVTGFLLPFTKVLPSHIVGTISLFALGIAIAARYVFRLKGAWRWIYVVTAVLSLYLNVLVLVVNLFRRVPPLTSIAPTQSEPPYVMTQFVVLGIFAVLGGLSCRRFKQQ